MCNRTQPRSCAVDNLKPNLKGLEDEAEELEELSKLALSPVGVYSMQVSPNPSEHPDDHTERAEEALVLIPVSSETAASEHLVTIESAPPQVTGEDPAHHITAASEPPTPAPEPTTIPVTKNNGRRTSHSWRGLKKQLSRVDLKLKNTFNATPAKKTSTFYGGTEQQPPENDDAGGGSSAGVPQIITEIDGQDQQYPRQDGGSGHSVNDHLHPSSPSSSNSSTATRPTELKLFDRDGKPIKPPRSSKEQHRKRTSLDKQGGNLTAGAGTSRDTRLLSVPNIKYSQRDPRHNRSNNQAFINLIKRLSKL